MKALNEIHLTYDLTFNLIATSQDEAELTARKKVDEFTSPKKRVFDNGKRTNEFSFTMRDCESQGVSMVGKLNVYRCFAVIYVIITNYE